MTPLVTRTAKWRTLFAAPSQTDLVSRNTERYEQRRPTERQRLLLIVATENKRKAKKENTSIVARTRGRARFEHTKLFEVTYKK